MFGQFDGVPTLNPSEAVDYKWIKITDLKSEIKLNPDKFTVWLRIMINNHFKHFKNYENNGLQKSTF